MSGPLQGGFFMTEAPKVIDLDREAIKEGLREGSFVLVDVREPHEFAAGHIPGAVSHPLSSFDPSVLPDGKRIVFSCAAGVRSVRAIEIAQARRPGHPRALQRWLQGLGCGRRACRIRPVRQVPHIDVF
jgi:rhodanese-related sulfurtransferase